MRYQSLISMTALAGFAIVASPAAAQASDADWVVKLIDVYPDTVPERPVMGGYELMVTGEIMRGRYRRSWEHPAAIAPNTVLPFTVDLHQQAYTFKRGHRIMVQVQGTWFPLYDRNPQTFVPNIFTAGPRSLSGASAPGVSHNAVSVQRGGGRPALVPRGTNG